MAKTVLTKITDIEVAKAVIAHEAVDCFCGTEQEASKQPRQLTSSTGGSFWGKPGEQWPQSADGEPLVPWLQIACTEMKRLYGAFYQRKAVCFYIRQELSDHEELSVADGGDFVVREYALTDDLVPLRRPTVLDGPFHQVTWKRLQDYPAVSKYHGLFDSAVYDALCEIKNFTYRNRSGIKIGGWPTPIQQNQGYPGSYDLQIDMTENYSYGDSGVGYLSRSGGQWYVRFETC